MTIKDYLQIEHLTVIEDELFITLVPDVDYKIIVSDTPDLEYYEPIEMKKQDEYSDIEVVYIYEVEEDEVLDASMNKNDSSIL